MAVVKSGIRGLGYWLAGILAFSFSLLNLAPPAWAKSRTAGPATSMSPRSADKTADSLISSVLSESRISNDEIASLMPPAQDTSAVGTQKKKHKTQPQQAMKLKTNSQPQQAMKLKTGSQPQQAMKLKTNSQPQQAMKLKTSSQPQQAMKLKTNSQPQQAMKLKTNSQPQQAMKLKTGNQKNN